MNAAERRTKITHLLAQANGPLSVDGDQFKVRIGFPVYGMTAK